MRNDKGVGTKMSAKHTIVINGTLYDAVSGLPLNVPKRQPAISHEPTAPKPTAAKPAPHVTRTPTHAAADIHQATRKSTTLRRSHLHAPKSAVAPSTQQRHATGAPRSPMITHFAAHPRPLPKRTETFIAEISPSPQISTPLIAPVRPSSQDVKTGLLAHAATKVSTAPVIHKAPKLKKHSVFARPHKLRHIVAACVAVILLAGYITYLNMPGLSVRIAAAQSGVAASYPDYQPDGYSFRGPVAFQAGEVELNFASNGGSGGYTINQRASNWNSIAVLENLVEDASGGAYVTTSEGGVIIYTYGNNAAWSNGGVLYTIEGDAPLNTDQLVRIAASM